MPKARRSTAAFVAIAMVAVALLAATFAFAAEKVTLYPPGSQDPATLNAGLAATEYGYHPEENHSWGESWYLLATDAKMNQIWVLLSVSNYGPVKFAGTVDLFWYGADGTKARGHVECKKDQIQADLNRVSVSIAGSTMTGKFPTYRLKAKAQDVALDLTYTSDVPDLQLGQGRLGFGEGKGQYWTVGVMTPRATVSGTVTIGEKTFPFRGKGYYDHGRSNLKIPSFSKAWTVLRVIQDDLAIGAMRIDMKPGYAPASAPVIWVALGNKIVVNSGNVSIKAAGGAVEKRSGITYPTKFAIDYADGATKLSGTVDLTRITEPLNVLDLLSPFVRALVKAFYTDPWQFRAVGQANLTLEHGGAKRAVRAPAVIELHFYK
jgi:hypothetical protein